MPTTTGSPSMACVRVPPAAVESDLLVVPWFEDDPPQDAANLDQATGGELLRALSSGEFSGKPFEFYVTPVTDRHWHTRRLARIGGGKQAESGAEMLCKRE